jgi:hypothetical protein
MLMPSMLHHLMHGTQQRCDSRLVLPLVSTHATCDIRSAFSVQPPVLEVDEFEKLKRWNKEAEEALLKWLELPDEYAQ